MHKTIALEKREFPKQPEQKKKSTKLLAAFNARKT